MPQQFSIVCPSLLKRVRQDAHAVVGEVTLLVDAGRQLDGDVVVPGEDGRREGSERLEGVAEDAAEYVSLPPLFCLAVYRAVQEVAGRPRRAEDFVPILQVERMPGGT